MLHKAAWAIGVLLLTSAFAAAQTAGPTEPIPAPKGAPAETAAPTDLMSQGQKLFTLQGTGQVPTVYADADYLMWWVHRGPAPTLLTTAPNNGNLNGELVGGPLGGAGTTAVFDARNLDYGTVSGWRVNLGVNLDSDGFWAVEANGFQLPKTSINFFASGNSAGVPLLTIPFLDASTAKQSSLDVSSQDNFGNPFLSGSVAIHSDLQLWGYELNAVAHSIRADGRSFDLLFGFRSLGLDENLTMTQSVTAQQAGAITLQYPTVGQGFQNYFNVPQGGVVTVLDSFSTRNRFYGVQMGGRFGWDFGLWDVELTGKVAVGVTNEEATISGSSTASALVGLTGSNFTTPGGTFALSTNSGTYSQTQFTMVPELGLNVNFNLASWVKLQVGYSGLYWSNVARPGAQIDPVLNAKLIPTGAFTPTTTNPSGSFQPANEQGRPTFTFHDTAFWAQGVHFGLEFRY